MKWNIIKLLSIMMVIIMISSTYVGADTQTRTMNAITSDASNLGDCDFSGSWTATVLRTNTSNDVYSTCLNAGSDLAGGSLGSPYLVTSNYSFSIPSGATINGIILDIERKASISGSNLDEHVQLIKSDGTYSSGDKAKADLWGNADSTISYGNLSYLWGETWTSTSINDVDFGGVISVFGEGLTTLSIDYMQITVNYTNASVAGTVCDGSKDCSLNCSGNLYNQNFNMKGRAVYINSPTIATGARWENLTITNASMLVGNVSNCIIYKGRNVTVTR